MLEASIEQRQQQQHHARPSIQEARRYALLLRQCGDRRDLSRVKNLHAKISSSGHERNRYLGNLLVQMYGKCGSVEEAWSVFDRIKNKNVFSWTIMIAAFAHNGHCSRAVELFWEMDVSPEEATLVAVLGACTKCGCYERGREVHDRIKACGLGSSLVLGNTLINMYGKCKRLCDAREVFDRLPERSIVSWNAIIGAYAQNHWYKQALQLYKEMKSKGIVPDEVTLLPVLQSCSGMQDLVEGEAVRELVIKQGLESNIVLMNALINMYGKCGSVAKARDLFEGMTNKSVVSLNTIISVYALNGCGLEALAVYRKTVPRHLEANDITFVVLLDACSSINSLEDGLDVHGDVTSQGFDERINVQNALINMYGKCGSTDGAMFVFQGMVSRDVVSWTATITALAQNDQEKDALLLFQKMDLEGMMANDITLAAVVSACVRLGNFRDGCQIHARIAALGMKPDVVLGTVLLSLHGDCGGDVLTAREIFEQIQHKNAISWNAMIGVYAQNGKNEEALALYREMPVPPNDATFASLLLDCSNVPYVDVVREEIKLQRLETSAVTGSALINAYGRLGNTDEAREAFHMIYYKDAVSWNSMISVYAQNGAAGEALAVYYCMNVEGVKPTEITYSSVLVSCPSLRVLRSVLDNTVSSGFITEVAVGNSLVTAFGRCGETAKARKIFDAMRIKSVVSWTSVIASYAQNGLVGESGFLFQEMVLEGVDPNEATFSSILYACSHAGLVDHGCSCFSSISAEFGKVASDENYRCMVDLLGRAGKLEECRELVHSMPFEADGVAWTSVLAACKTHSGEEEGREAAKAMMSLEPNNGASYIILSSLIPTSTASTVERKIPAFSKHEEN